MKKTGNNDVQEAFADFLLRKLAAGESPASSDKGSNLDANDVAGFVRGALLPGRRTAFQRALLTNPDLREAVAFEESLVRRERRSIRFRRAAIAAAAAVVVLAIVPFLISSDPDPLQEGKKFLRGGDPAQAVASLEEAYADRPALRTAELLALARFGAGHPNPLAGLNATSVDFLDLTEAESRGHVVTRNLPADRTPALGNHGRILDLRPDLVVRHAGAPLRLLLYGFEDPKPLVELTLEKKTAGQIERVPLPAGVHLVPGNRYGMELWVGNRRRPDVSEIEFTDFKIAASHAKRACESRATFFAEFIRDPVRRSHALGNFFMRNGFYQQAVLAWSSVPMDRRTQALIRDLEIAEQNLWD
ncbi:MAG: hypothetical protein CMJ83_05560 [Planctomycetes bacterium]|nr:hypothetical protein [Planctomycetota bacterium]